jgi:hypothetical protein
MSAPNEALINIVFEVTLLREDIRQPADDRATPVALLTAKLSPENVLAVLEQDNIHTDLINIRNGYLAQMTINGFSSIYSSSDAEYLSLSPEKKIVVRNQELKNLQSMRNNYRLTPMLNLVLNLNLTFDEAFKIRSAEINIIGKHNVTLYDRLVELKK